MLPVFTKCENGRAADGRLPYPSTQNQNWITMTKEVSIALGESTERHPHHLVIHVEPAPHRFSRRLLLLVLMASLLLNGIWIIRSLWPESGSEIRVRTVHRSGDPSVQDRIAVINFVGTISPPFTERWRRQVKQATDDDNVKGVMLSIDSPGGLVADSHQIFHDLQNLSAKKPVFVSMKRLCASGGYYIAMGIGQNGRIYAEPTTWTGSIGVIIPRYNAAELASTYGVKVEPLATGPFKDSLNPFRDMRDDEREVWDAILDDAFKRFVSVIHENRTDLDEDGVRKLATGQIYTASQALSTGLIDHIGWEDEAIESLAAAAGLSDYQVVQYGSSGGLVDLLLGGEARRGEVSVLEQILDSSVPRAMYYCSWNPWVPRYAE